jgi:hypothetical protein
MDMQYTTHFTYADYLRNKAWYEHVPNSYTYSSYFYKGLTVGAKCPSWNMFATNVMQLPFDNVAFSRLVLASEYYDFSTRKFRNETAGCSDRGVIKNIVASVQQKTVYAANCEQRQWRVFPCAGRSVLCVNCKQSCVATEVCPGTALVMNPCTACKIHAAAVAVFNAQYEVKVLYPRFTAPLVVNATRTTVAVKVNVSAPGNIYCAAFATGRTIHAVGEMRSAGVYAVVPAAGVYTLRVKQLWPYSAYTAQCFTEDFAQHVMPLNMSLASAVTFSTKCCRAIEVVTSYPKVAQYIANSGRLETPFAIQVSSRPVSGTVTVSTKLHRVSCLDNSLITTVVSAVDASVLPPSFQFTTAATSLVGTFLVRAATTACYRILFTSTGLDVYDPANVTFLVQNSRVAADVPILTTVQLSDAGAALLFNFDSPTDMGVAKFPTLKTSGSFACSLLVTFSGSSGATCKWANLTQLVATAAPTASLPAVGATASVLADVVQAYCAPSTNCQLYNRVPLTSRTILAPYNPVKPTVVLLSAPVIAPCANISLDPTQSAGSGRSAWKDVVWSVKAASSIANNTATIESYLNANFKGTNVFAVIPNAILTRSTPYVDSTYMITLALTNFLLQTSQAAVFITVSADGADILPVVTLSGSRGAVYRNQPLNVFAAVTWPACASAATTRLPVAISWKLYNGLSYVSTARSNSADKRYYKLPAYSLEAGTTYTLSATAIVNIGPRSLNVLASTTLEVGRSGVTAVIAGALSRTASTQRDVFLDASGSSDVDYPGGSGLSYLWTCAEYAPTFGAACDDFTSTNTAVLKIPATLLLARTYTMSVTATNAAGLYSTAAVVLSMVGSAVPAVILSNGRVKYNPDDKIVLTASIPSLNKAAVAQWSSPSILNFATSDYALTPLSKAIPRGESNFYQLSLAAGKLTAGLSYTFQLALTYNSDNTAVSTSSVVVVINAPPTGGIVSVVPSEGIALQDLFFISTSQWADQPEDLPLSYVISTYAVSVKQLLVLKAVDTVSFVRTILGQGLQSADFKLTCYVTATDAYGSAGVATAQVRVIPIASTSVIVGTTTSALTLAVLDANPTAVYQAVGAALASVNSVDCTVPRPCSSVNRLPCSATAGTCGPCLDGFLGPSGDSNIPCNSTAVLRRLGASCTADSMCLLGSCVNNVCVDVPKTCPLNCGNRGRCVYTDLDNNVVANCTVSDTGCRAQCQCNFNRFGPSCSLVPFDYAQLLLLREALCAGMYATINLQDVSADVVTSRVVSINSVLQDPSQISNAALRNCTAALVDTIVKHPDLTCQGDTLDQASSALSRILERGSALPRSLLASVNSALTALTTGCQATAVVGEVPVTIATTYMRVSSLVVDVSQGEEYRIEVPLTDFERFSGRKAPSVTLNNSHVSFGTSIGAAVLQYNNNPRKVKTNSTSVTVQTVQYTDTTADASRRVLTTADEPGITVVLFNKEPITYGYQIASKHQVRCFEYRSTPYLRNVTCANGAVSYLTCPAHAKGVFNVTCPGYHSSPQCTTYEGEEFVVDPDCQVIAYTPYNTTCYCKHATTRRYLADDGAATVTEYSTTFKVIGEDFAETFISAPSLTDVRENTVILSVLAAVVALFFVGLIAFTFWDGYNARKYKEAQKKQLVTYRVVEQFFDEIFPVELRAGPWYVILWRNLLLEHPWISLCAASTGERNQRGRVLKWTIAVGQLLIFLFVNCIIASVMYADDGYCEGFSEPARCEAAMTTGDLFHACKWRTDNESCEFQPPNIDFDTTIVLVLISTMLSIPFEQVLEYTAKKIAQHLRHRQTTAAKIIPTDFDEKPAIVGLEPRFDEFALAQTPRATFYRAARLEKARLSMDYILPDEEAELLYQKAQAEQLRWRNHKLFKNAVEQNTFSTLRYTFNPNNKRGLTRKVRAARDRAVDLKTEMDRIENDQDKETFMMRHFIVNNFKGHQRSIVAKYFLRDYNFRRNKYTIYEEYFSIVFLPIMLAVMTYYVYVFNLSIGSRSTNMWLLVVAINFLQDVLFLLPLKLWINFVIINGNVSKDVRELCERLCLRTKLVMMRTHGMMRDADALVQHFNPACRAARMIPELPISRLLLSLNDHDIPLRKGFKWFLLPYAFFAAGLLSLALLPEFLQDVTLEIVSSSMFDLGIVGLKELGVQSTAGMIVFVVVSVGTIVLWEWKKAGFRLPRARTAVTATELKVAESLFHSLDDDDLAPLPAAKKPKISTGKSTKRRFTGLSDVAEHDVKAQQAYADEDVIVSSDLINFDDYHEVRENPDPELRAAMASSMGSVLALQSFKRPPTAVAPVIHARPTTVEHPRSPDEEQLYDYGRSIRKVSPHLIRAKSTQMEADDSARYEGSVRAWSPSDRGTTRFTSVPEASEEQKSTTRDRERRESASSQLSEVGFSRKLAPVSGPPLSSQIDRVFGSTKAALPAASDDAMAPLPRPVSGAPVSGIATASSGVEESKYGAEPVHSAVAQFEQHWQPPSEVLRGSGGGRRPSSGQYGTAFNAVSGPSEGEGLTPSARYRTGNRSRHRLPPISRNPGSPGTDRSVGSVSPVGPGFGSGHNNFGASRPSSTHHTNGLGPGGQSSLIRESDRMNTSTVLLHMREGRHAALPTAAGVQPEYLHALRGNADPFIAEGGLGFHGPDDSTQHGGEGAPSTGAGAGAGMGGYDSFYRPPAHRRGSSAGGGGGGPGAAATGPGPAGPGSSLYQGNMSPPGRSPKSRKHPMLYMG